MMKRPHISTGYRNCPNLWPPVSFDLSQPWRPYHLHRRYKSSGRQHSMPYYIPRICYDCWSSLHTTFLETYIMREEGINAIIKCEATPYHLHRRYKSSSHQHSMPYYIRQICYDCWSSPQTTFLETFIVRVKGINAMYLYIFQGSYWIPYWF